MIKKSFLLGAIASVIAINSVFADATITTKNYVDTTRQATIPASGTNANTPGETVVTYTDTAGTIGERGIFNPATDFDDVNGEIVSGHEGDLLDAGSIMPVLVGMGSMVQNMSNDIQEIQYNMHDFDDLPETTVTYKTCTEWLDGAAHTDQNCILWNLGNKDVVGGCRSNDECNGGCTMCVDGACVIDPNCQA